LRIKGSMPTVLACAQCGMQLWAALTPVDPHRLAKRRMATFGPWSHAMAVNPVVAIVFLLVFLVLALTALFRAKPDDIPKLFKSFWRWFGK